MSDEFRFLAGDATRVGRTAPLPHVERVAFLLRDGRSISALRFEPQDPPRVVALHGAGLNAHSFDPFILALDVPALSIDLAGHGRSDWREDADYRPDHLADDIVQVLDRAVPQPVVLVGHSLGGLTAALVAAAIPELVSRLVTVDITPGISPRRDAGGVAEFITGQRSYGSIEEIVERAVQFGIGSDRQALTRGASLNTRVRPDGRFEWTHHFAHLDALPTGGSDDPQPYAPIWASLQSLEIPITLVRAANGILDDALVADWHERLPRSVVRSINGSHNLHESAPVELAETVSSVLPNTGAI
ncbi:alpha/beta hydrolase [Leucobacter insecticola]|uniref:Alpha/beta hydrolase n=1 Tax=Leucobacter insecticola TaxID=2714934 RepID=A0A6G8FKG0_9MICO|nr:alpha/beta hydrolase [Leucobacter insecticola]QIM16841.1 alpha/beta hydrolase [Leucobacter insecticola]